MYSFTVAPSRFHGSPLGQLCIDSCDCTILLSLRSHLRMEKCLSPMLSPLFACIIDGYALFRSNGSFPTPTEVVNTDIATLRTVGLSQRKAEYSKPISSLGEGSFHLPMICPD